MKAKEKVRCPLKYSMKNFWEANFPENLKEEIKKEIFETIKEKAERLEILDVNFARKNVYPEIRHEELTNHYILIEPYEVLINKKDNAVCWELRSGVRLIEGAIHLYSGKEREKELHELTEEERLRLVKGLARYGEFQPE